MLSSDWSSDVCSSDRTTARLCRSNTLRPTRLVLRRGNARHSKQSPCAQQHACQLFIDPILFHPSLLIRNNVCSQESVFDSYLRTRGEEYESFPFQMLSNSGIAYARHLAYRET